MNAATKTARVLVLLAVTGIAGESAHGAGLYVSCRPSQPEVACGPGRVHCGATANTGEMPFAASIVIGKEAIGLTPKCAATIVRPIFSGGKITGWGDTSFNEMPRYLLTAAHCTREGNDDDLDTSRLRVIIGQVDLKNENRLVFKIDKMVAHDDYEYATYDNDIAVVRLTDPVEVGDLDQFGWEALHPAMNLDDAHKLTRPYAAAHLGGWGIMQTREPTCNLQVLRLPIVDAEVCRRAAATPPVTYSVTDDDICAGFSSGTYSICGGDSGGPLVHYNLGNSPVGRNMLIGIVSGTDGCGLAGERYQTFTSVAFHAEFIKSTIEALEAEAQAEEAGQ